MIWGHHPAHLLPAAAANRLGIDYKTLNKINPRLIYCSITGYGQEGPYRDLPGHDLNYQALVGMLECFKDKEGHYIAPGLAIGDLSSGMFAALGIMAALMAREKTGRGHYVDVSMSDGLLALMTTLLTGSGGRLTEFGTDAGYGIFEAGDKKHFTLGIAHENWFWDRLCTSLGLDDYNGLNGMERRQRKKEIVGKLQEVFYTKPREEWVKILTEADVPVSPVNGLNEVSEDPHVKYREMVQEITLNSGESMKQISFPVQISEMPREIRMLPPSLGEHNSEILTDLGYAEDDIERLKEEGVV